MYACLLVYVFCIFPLINITQSRAYQFPISKPETGTHDQSDEYTKIFWENLLIQNEKLFEFKGNN